MRASTSLVRTKGVSQVRLDVAVDGPRVAYALMTGMETTAAFRVTEDFSPVAADDAYRALVLRALEDGFDLARLGANPSAKR